MSPFSLFSIISLNIADLAEHTIYPFHPLSLPYPMTWFLIDPSGYRYPIGEPGLSVGRAADNDVVLNDDEASRHHAFIQPQGEQAWLYDRGSSNGVYVNDKRIKGPHRLRSGQRVRVGRTTMRAELVDIPDLVAPPAAPQSAPAKPQSANSQTWVAALAGAFVGLVGLVIVFILFVRPALGGAAPAAPAQPGTDIYTNVLRSIAFVLSPIGDTPTSVGGTGVILTENGRLLTAYDVVYDPNTGRPYNRKSQVLVGMKASGIYAGEAMDTWYLARVVRADRRRDLAVLQIFAQANGSPLPNSFRLRPAPTSSADTLQLGAPLSVLSFTGGEGGDQDRNQVGRMLALGQGQATGFVADEGLGVERGWIQSDISLTQNNVGGLALDGRGRLVGIYTGAEPQGAAGILRPIDLAEPLLAGAR